MQLTMRILSISVLATILSVSTANAGMLNPGDPFPSWTLTDHNGATVSSTSLAGRPYLVWFYPKASTPGCTAEGQGLRDRYPELQQLQLQVFGVSFDQPKDNAEFVKEHSFPFALLSDTDRKLGLAVGAAESADQAAAKRISYLVGADGKVLKVYPSVDPAAHADEVIRDLKASRAL